MPSENYYSSILFLCLLIAGSFMLGCKDGNKSSQSDAEIDPRAQPLATSIAIIRQPKEEETTVFMTISNPASGMHAQVAGSSCFPLTLCTGSTFYSGTANKKINENESVHISIYTDNECSLTPGNSTETVTNAPPLECE